MYRHSDGTFAAPVYVRPVGFTVIEGLLGYHLPEMLDAYDVRVYLNPPEDLRRRWKVQRDCSRRGYDRSGTGRARSTRAGLRGVHPAPAPATAKAAIALGGQGLRADSIAGQADASSSPTAEIEATRPLDTQQRTMSRIERMPVTSAPSITIT